MTLYDAIFRHAFTRVDPERAHHLGFRAIRAAGPVLRRRSLPGEPVEAMGLTFPNVLGLAAGFDKQGIGYEALAGLGFGHVEIGTVTALAQPGNPAPRMFRFPEDRAVLNRMGFNNDGAVAVAARLAAAGRRGPGAGPVLGINIGKSKVVPDDDQAAVEADYETSTRLLTPFADYLVVNVSSPNTPGLRNLQSVEKLAPLLRHVRAVADATVAPGQARDERRVPLLVKIAPDLADEDVLAVGDLALDLGLDGIIATNTTISRAGLRTPRAAVEAAGAGGVSGAPVRDRATAVMRMLRDRVGPDLTLIGVGGISTPQDARERLDAGATLIQAYTGFIYGGPAWPRRIVEGVGR